MFNKLYKLLKIKSHSTNEKKKYNLFLVKDLKQYKLEYITILNYMLGLKWVLGDKKISFKSYKLRKLLYYIFWFFFYIYLFLFLIY